MIQNRKTSDKLKLMKKGELRSLKCRAVCGRAGARDISWKVATLLVVLKVADEEAEFDFPLWEGRQQAFDSLVDCQLDTYLQSPQFSYDNITGSSIMAEANDMVPFIIMDYAT
ncbi:uncharacterized protein G2W53_033818 [Senna tora]|uniref:Uncharacterized protein n=1 Tax=Senna tora TaxID=362788 RepID=A0A834W8D3_9FABA|nr:uncharacterized protein G2W53_033818 [Senna tora]